MELRRPSSLPAVEVFGEEGDDWVGEDLRGGEEDFFWRENTVDARASITGGDRLAARKEG